MSIYFSKQIVYSNVDPEMFNFVNRSALLMIDSSTAQLIDVTDPNYVETQQIIEAGISLHLLRV